MMLRMNVNELQPLIVEIFDLSSGHDKAEEGEGGSSTTTNTETPESSATTSQHQVS